MVVDYRQNGALLAVKYRGKRKGAAEVKTQFMESPAERCDGGAFGENIGRKRFGGFVGCEIQTACTEYLSLC